MSSIGKRFGLSDAQISEIDSMTLYGTSKSWEDTVKLFSIVGDYYGFHAYKALIKGDVSDLRSLYRGIDKINEEYAKQTAQVISDPIKVKVGLSTGEEELGIDEINSRINDYKQKISTKKKSIRMKDFSPTDVKNFIDKNSGIQDEFFLKVNELISDKEVRSKFEEQFKFREHNLMNLEMGYPGLNEILDYDRRIEECYDAILDIRVKAFAEKRNVTSYENSEIEEIIKIIKYFKINKDKLLSFKQNMMAYRLHTLKKYHRQLKTTGYVITPSRQDLIERIVDIILHGGSTLLTGPTGTGKTVLGVQAAKIVSEKMCRIYKETIAKKHGGNAPKFLDKYDGGIQEISGSQLADEISIYMKTHTVSDLTNEFKRFVESVDKIDLKNGVDVISGHAGITIGDFIAKPGLKGDGKGGTQTFTQIGKLLEAWMYGRIPVIDEVDLIPNEIFMRIKHLFTMRPGDIYYPQEDGGVGIPLKTTGVIGTANIQSTKHSDRVNIDPAVLRLFDPLEVRYLPKQEMFDLIVAQLMQSNGFMYNISREDIDGLNYKADKDDTGRTLIGSDNSVIGCLINAIKGIEENYLQTSSEKIGSKDKLFLKKAVVEMGKLMRLLRGFHGCGKGLHEFIKSKIIDIVVSNGGYDKYDILILITIFGKQKLLSLNDANEIHSKTKSEVSLEEIKGCLIDGSGFKTSEVRFIDPAELVLLDPFGELKINEMKELSVNFELLDFFKKFNSDLTATANGDMNILNICNDVAEKIIIPMQSDIIGFKLKDSEIIKLFIDIIKNIHDPEEKMKGFLFIDEAIISEEKLSEQLNNLYTDKFKDNLKLLQFLSNSAYSIVSAGGNEDLLNFVNAKIDDLSKDIQNYTFEDNYENNMFIQNYIAGMHQAGFLNLENISSTGIELLPMDIKESFMSIFLQYKSFVTEPGSYMFTALCKGNIDLDSFNENHDYFKIVSEYVFGIGYDNLLNKFKSDTTNHFDENTVKSSLSKFYENIDGINYQKFFYESQLQKVLNDANFTGTDPKVFIEGKGIMILKYNDKEGWYTVGEDKIKNKWKFIKDKIYFLDLNILVGTGSTEDVKNIEGNSSNPDKLDINDIMSVSTKLRELGFDDDELLIAVKAIGRFNKYDISWKHGAKDAWKHLMETYIYELGYNNASKLTGILNEDYDSIVHSAYKIEGGRLFKTRVSPGDIKVGSVLVLKTGGRLLEVKEVLLENGLSKYIVNDPSVGYILSTRLQNYYLLDGPTFSSNDITYTGIEAPSANTVFNEFKKEFIGVFKKDFDDILGGNIKIDDKNMIPHNLTNAQLLALKAKETLDESNINIISIERKSIDYNTGINFFDIIHFEFDGNKFTAVSVPSKILKMQLKDTWSGEQMSKLNTNLLQTNLAFDLPIGFHLSGKKWLVVGTENLRDEKGNLISNLSTFESGRIQFYNKSENTDVVRECAKRGFRPMSILDNVVLAEIVKDYLGEEYVNFYGGENYNVIKSKVAHIEDNLGIKFSDLIPTGLGDNKLLSNVGGYINNAGGNFIFNTNTLLKTGIKAGLFSMDLNCNETYGRGIRL